MKLALIGRYGEREIVAGPERVARELFFELKKNNPQTVFIEYFFSGYANSSIYKKLFGKEFIHDNSIVRLGIFPLITFLVKEEFKIIHIVNLQRFILILFFLKPFIKSKITATLHGFLRYEIPRKNLFIKRYFIDLWVEKLIISKCKLCVYPSRLLFETFSNNYNISNKKYEIIPNGISEIFKSQNRNFPPINNSLRIVFYNGFNENINKGLPELIVLLKDVNFKIEFFVVGKKVDIESSGNFKIIYSGTKSHQEMIRLLDDKHFVVKSPTFEPFSIFVAECMISGVIPIVNQNVGIKDFIKHNFNGFIYDSLSLTDLSRLIEEIFEGKYDLDIISTNAKKIFETLNWNKVTRQYYQSFKGIMK